MVTRARNKKDPEQSQSVAARWTDILAERGFTPIANVFMEKYSSLEITPTEAMLICHLMSFKWTEDAPYPSVPRLAKLMRCSDRYVRKMCQNLESVGLIKRIGREGTSNAFDLSGLFTKLEAIVIAEKLEAARKSQKKDQAAAKKRKTMEVETLSAPMDVQWALQTPQVEVTRQLGATHTQLPQLVVQPLRRTVRHPLQSMETGVEE
ncbi:helix-turn-helix domain-containing protein [Cystobacter fuscus]|uniref:helix-turn-helix domain-containing protein n=1 Tax=Cystobacter fuscus TaxID=43 RepID=UPI0037BF08B1